MVQKELYHHGIKGMKWGRRRYQNKDGTLTPAGRKRYGDNWSDDAKAAKQLRKKSVNEMSNAELRRLNERNNLERQYYSNLKPSRITKGLAFVGAAAATANTLVNLYEKSNKLVKLGKEFAG